MCAAILPSVKIDSDAMIREYFMPHQVAWILAEDPFHQRRKQVFAIAEKSVRIGWTYADAFKNVRKRLRFPKRDYLFATKDYPSALEYMRTAQDFAELLNFTRAIVAHGEDYLNVSRLDPSGRPTAFTEEVKISYIKFDNGSRIIAFSAHPQAMAVYGGDVGLDEFAKHPNAELLWQTAQGRVTWAYDLAVWSSHQGEDTLFNQFVHQARASLQSPAVVGRVTPCAPQGNSTPGHDAADIALEHREDASSPREMASVPPISPGPIQIPNSKIENPSSPWNLYFRVTIADAIELGLLDVINQTRDAALTPEQFILDCRNRSGAEEIFEQTYMCNPVPGGAAIVDWSCIERCRADYQIEHVHLEASQVLQLFGDFNPHSQLDRTDQIHSFLRKSFPILFGAAPAPAANTLSAGGEVESSIQNRKSKIENRLGFDIAASGQGDLAAFYLDESRGSELWLRALLTARTEDWHFLKTTLFYFLRELRNVRAAGDESGLGRQICWEAAKQFPSRFTAVNFTGKKHDLGFSLMNQLSVAEKRFPRADQDIAADFFALRKHFTGSKWVFSEGRNSYNPASHCDIAWAAALSSHAHTIKKSTAWAYLG
jgi:phage FluMu gp28-like protein